MLGREDEYDPVIWDLASEGFSFYVIRNSLQKLRLPCSFSTICKSLKRQKLSVRDFRNGETKHSREQIKKLILPYLRG